MYRPVTLGGQNPKCSRYRNNSGEELSVLQTCNVTRTA